MSRMFSTGVKFLLGLSVCGMLVSCTSSFESQGNAAYSKAPGATGDEQRRLEKTAYQCYRQAVNDIGDRSKVPMRLRSRYIEMTIRRGQLVMDEANIQMDAIDIFFRDVDSMLTPEVSPELRQMYALFIERMADSTNAHNKLKVTMDWLDKAIAVAQDPSSMRSKKDALVQNYVTQNLDLAKMEFDVGKSSKSDAAELIRAEFHAKLAQYFDPSSDEAAKLLAQIYPLNRSAYSAYEAVVEEKPDSAIYRAINKYDILLAIPTINEAGVSMKVSLFNYSWSPLRLWARDFYLEDVDGKRVQATTASHIEPEILDQERETLKLNLVFPKPAGEIKKLVYETETKDHKTEKMIR